MTRALAIIGAIGIAAHIANLAYGGYHGATGQEMAQCPSIAYAYGYGFWGAP